MQAINFCSIINIIFICLAITFENNNVLAPWVLNFPGHSFYPTKTSERSGRFTCNNGTLTFLLSFSSQHNEFFRFTNVLCFFKLLKSVDATHATRNCQSVIAMTYKNARKKRNHVLAALQNEFLRKFSKYFPKKTINVC